VSSPRERGRCERDKLILAELYWQAAGERDALREALASDPERWSFGTLVRIAETLLEANHPPEVFDGSSGDPGPVFVARLRDALAEIRR
jgi:hypothetical protein